MARSCIYGVPVLLALIVTLFAPSMHAAPQGGTLEGRWKLVEQHYGKGTANLADLEAPVILEFYRDLESAAGRILVGEGSTEPLAWPAFVSGGSAIAVEVIDQQIDSDTGFARSHYSVRPSPDDDMVLDMVEEYVILEEEGALVGTVTVTFTVGEEERGSFVLHRRFERTGR